MPVPEVAKKAPQPVKSPARNASKDAKEKQRSALAAETSVGSEINKSTKMTVQDASLTTVEKDSKMEQLGIVGQTGTSEVILP